VTTLRAFVATRYRSASAASSPSTSSAAPPFCSRPHAGPGPRQRSWPFGIHATKPAPCRFGGFGGLEPLVIIGCDQMASGPTKHVLRPSSHPYSPPAGVKLNTLTQQRTNVSDIGAASQNHRWVSAASKKFWINRTFTEPLPTTGAVPVQTKHELLGHSLGTVRSSHPSIAIF